MSVSKCWNIGIGGQSNIGNWPNIGEKSLKYLYRFLKNIGVCVFYPVPSQGWESSISK